MLYCPRGFPHIVEAGDEPSLHVSLSTFATTWADILGRALADVVESDPAFRAGLTPGYLTAPDAGLERTFARLTRKFAEIARLEPALRSARRDFLASRRPRADDARRQLQQAGRLGAATWIRGVPDTCYLIELAEDAITLAGLGKEIRFHPAAHDALARALDTPGCRICDLPGDIGDEAKIDLAHTLVQHGFVAVA